jgi:hypothetical protein
MSPLRPSRIRPLTVLLFKDAKTVLLSSLSMWLPAYQAVIENRHEASVSDPIDVCPLLYTTRISTAKLLIELELFDESVQVSLGFLRMLNDRITEYHLFNRFWKVC